MSEIDWSAEYSRQRKDRMQDAIEDYLHDSKVDARRTYEEMLSCIDDTIKHHEENLEKAVSLKELMLGYRDIGTTAVEIAATLELESLSHEMKEALSEDCEDYLLHRNIPLHSHSYDNIIIQALREGYQMVGFDRGPHSRLNYDKSNC